MIEKAIEKFADSKSKTFFTFCFCFLIGVALASGFEWKIKFIHLYILFFLILSLVIFHWVNKKARIVFISIIFLVLGFARYSTVFPEFNESQINFYNGRVHTIDGYISSEPDVRLDEVKYIIRAQKVVNFENNVGGYVYVSNALYPRFSYGDKVKFTCELKKPKPIDSGEKTFLYDMYLARMNVFSSCSYAKIEKIGEGEGSKIYSGILRAKSKLAEKIIMLWHEPHASFVAGLLYGYRGGLGNLNDDFTRTGITHIVAISGYNITIIATLFIFLLIRCRVRRQIAFWIIFVGISLFVIFTGASASVVRAGIMGILVLLATQIGRASKAGNMMMLAAAIMTMQNPLILLYDAGFQLSFASTLGIVYLNPIITKYFSRIPELYGLKENAIATFSAIIATLPLILYQFGRLSLVAPIVNILILWLIPFLMAGGAVVVIISFIYFPLGRILAWLVWLGLEYIIRIAHWFASLTFSSVEIAFPLWLTILSYCGMIYIIKLKDQNPKVTG